MSASWAGGSTRAWRKVRAFVLDRDQGLCKLRLPGCTTVAEHCHHTRPRALVGDDPRYLLAACQHCNLSAGEPEEDPQPRPLTRW